MKFAVITVLVMLVSVCRAQQPVPIESGAMTPPSISLFVSCDLTEEFVTPGMDTREVLWLGTPVSRAGARMLEESRRQCVVAQVPLVLESNALNRADAFAQQFGAEQGHIRLLASNNSDLHDPAGAFVAPRARTVTSQWVHVRGLNGR